MGSYSRFPTPSEISAENPPRGFSRASVNSAISSNAKATGLIPTLRPLLNELMDQAGFWISTELYERTLGEIGEL